MQDNEDVVHIQYCINCHSHNWCTHHNQAKYHQAYSKLTHRIREYFPGLKVHANHIPPHLIPIKLSQNKFFHASLNKCINYPQIGAFEVTFRGQLLFSKKSTNAWPHHHHIIQQIRELYQGPFVQSLFEQQNKHSETDNATEKYSVSNDAANDKRKTFCSNKQNFTLTDHFQLYKKKQKNPSYTDNYQKDSKQYARYSSNIKDIKKSLQTIGYQKERIPQFLEKKAYLRQQLGKKEMIVKLDSIEEESIPQNQSPSTNRFKRDNSPNLLMNKWNEELSSLEKKFKKFEEKVEKIKKKNNQYEEKSPKITQECLRGAMGRHSNKMNRTSKLKDASEDHISGSFRLLDDDISHVRDNAKNNLTSNTKLDRIQQYLKATDQQKNQKLKKIYGQWKIVRPNLKQPNHNKLTHHRTISEASDTNDDLSNRNNQYTRQKHRKPNLNPIQQAKTKQSEQKTNKDNQIFHTTTGHPFQNLIKTNSNPDAEKNSVNSKQKKESQLRWTTDKQNRKGVNYNDNEFKHFNSLSSFKITKKNDIPHKSSINQKQNNHFSKGDITSLAHKQLQSKHKPNKHQFINNTSKQQNTKYQDIRQNQKSNFNYFNKQHQSIHTKKQNYNNNNNSIRKQQSSSQQDKYFITNKQQNLSSQSQEKTVKAQLISNQENNHQLDRKNKIIQSALSKNQNKFNDQSKRKIKNIKQQNNHSKSSFKLSEDSQIRQQKSIINNFIDSNQASLEKSNLKLYQKKTKNKKENLDSKFKEFNKTNKDNHIIINQQIAHSQNESQFESRQKQQFQKFHKNNQKKSISKIKNKTQQKLNCVESEQSFNQSQNQINNFQSPDNNQMIQSQITNKTSKAKTKRYSPKQNQSQYEKQINLVKKQKRKIKQGKQKKNYHQNKSSKSYLKQSYSSFSPIKNLQQKKNVQKQSINKQQIKKINLKSQKKRTLQQDNQQLKRNPKQKNKQKYKKQLSQQYHKINKHQNQDQLQISQNNELFQGIQSQQQFQNLQNNNQCQQTQSNNQQEKKLNKIVKQNIKQQIRNKNNKNNQSQNHLKQKQQSRKSSISKIGLNDKNKQSSKTKNQSLKKETKSNNNKILNKNIQKNSQKVLRESKKKNQRQIEKLQEKIKISKQKSQNKKHEINSQHQSSSQDQQIQLLSNESQIKNHKYDSVNKKFTQQKSNIKSKSINKKNITQNNKNNQNKQIINSNKKNKNKDNNLENKKLQNNSKKVKYNRDNVSQKVTKRKKIDENKSNSNSNQQFDENQSFQNQSINEQRQLSDNSGSFIEQNLNEKQLNKNSQKLQKKNNNKKKKIITLADNKNILTNGQKNTNHNIEQKQDKSKDQQTIKQQQSSKQQKQVTKKKHIKDQEQINDIINSYNQKQKSSNQQNFIRQQDTKKLICKDKQIQQKQKATKNQQEERNINSQKQGLKIKNKNQQDQVQEQQQQCEQQYTNSQHQQQEFYANYQFDNVERQVLKKQNKNRKQIIQYIDVGVQKDNIQEKGIQTDNLKNNIQTHKKKNKKNKNKKKKSNIYQEKQNNQILIKQSQKQLTQYINPNQNQKINQKYYDYNEEMEYERADILKNIYGEFLIQQASLYQKKFYLQTKQIDIPIDNLTKNCQWYKISTLFPNKSLFDKKSIGASLVQYGIKNILNFRQIVKILGEKNQLIITRIFQNINTTKPSIYGIWLCDKYSWKCVIVNDLVPICEKSNRPFFSYHKNAQLWPIILQKAMAKLVGGYQKLSNMQVNQLFHMLTGSNYLTFTMKQQYSKNYKFISFLSQNQNKNFIIIADKQSINLQQNQKKQKQVIIYYVLSQKIVNEKQILIRVKQSNMQPFWVKFDIFINQFNSVSILQLRFNHNFTYIELNSQLNKLKSDFIVSELKFQQNLFGAVTLSYPQKPGFLKIYLYKEQQNNILRLVGQAKQKFKYKLFFDCMFSKGRYYIFAQTQHNNSRLSYMGQGQPSICIKEFIHNQQLKNNVTEYLPVNMIPKNKQYNKEPLPKTIIMGSSQNIFRETQNSFGSSFTNKNDGFKLQKIKQNFIQYLINNRE